MARFRFKLEALLEHRQMVEKEKQRRVAQIQQEIQVIQRQIQDAQMRIALENRTLGTRELTGRLDMTYIATEKKYVGNLQLKIVYAFQKIVEIEKTLAVARAELLEAAKARKVIEKLREKQLARWREELERKEAAAMDEIGTQLAVRGAQQ
ncbi:MAG TPA: flagellar export protein FliJ [Phycisphaerae bacterium]|nr:flagellar export protein FliJ [Phycisphaerae bacterium]